MNKLTLHSEKEFKNFGLAFGLGFLLVSIFPMLYGLFNSENPISGTTIGMIFLSVFSSPTILFLAIAFFKGYKEKAVFWVGFMGIWLNVMLNTYLLHGGEVVYLETIFHALSRKLVAMIITLLILRHLFKSHSIIQLFGGFGLLILMAIISSFAQFSEQLTTNELVEQSLWGALFYILGLSLGYIFFSIFNGKNDHEGTEAEVTAPDYKSSHLVFYFMIFCLYFADIWMGQTSMRNEMNVLFQLFFASIGVVYFTKNIITIGMALTLLSLIGRIIAFSKDMSTINSVGVVITLLFLALFELSRRSENGKNNEKLSVKN